MAFYEAHDEKAKIPLVEGLLRNPLHKLALALRDKYDRLPEGDEWADSLEFCEKPLEVSDVVGDSDSDAPTSLSTSASIHTVSYLPVSKDENAVVAKTSSSTSSPIPQSDTTKTEDGRAYFEHVADANERRRGQLFAFYERRDRSKLELVDGLLRNSFRDLCDAIHRKYDGELPAPEWALSCSLV